uniref:Uncharacterized protein n=1 Tax=Elaeophora elaphi TaxID=1147741 RepID=A0A0R3S2Q1_9BILA
MANIDRSSKNINMLKICLTYNLPVSKDLFNLF